MGIQDKIREMLDRAVSAADGNKAEAARRVNTNTVTFWGWYQGKRGLNPVLCEAIDNAGGRLVFPWDEQNNAECSQCQTLKEEIRRLTDKNEALLEAITAQAAGQSKNDGEQHQLRLLTKEQKS